MRVGFACEHGIFREINSPRNCIIMKYLNILKIEYAISLLILIKKAYRFLYQSNEKGFKIFFS